MKDQVLAFVENNIALRLLLASRLSALGYHVTVVSNLRAFRSGLAVRPVDWLILDEAALARGRNPLAGVADHLKGVRVVWLGGAPQRWRVPVEAVLATPLRYDEVTQFFSKWAPREATVPAVQSPGTGLRKIREPVRSCGDSRAGSGRAHASCARQSRRRRWQETAVKG